MNHEEIKSIQETMKKIKKEAIKLVEQNKKYREALEFIFSCAKGVQTNMNLTGYTDQIVITAKKALEEER